MSTPPPQLGPPPAPARLEREDPLRDSLAERTNATLTAIAPLQSAVQLEVLGWPPDGPTMRLDHERFAYAGKFVTGRTGKAVARDGGELVAAVSFDPDRTDDSVLRLRYVTVRIDRRGEGIGPQLIAFVRDRALERGYDRVRISVNNPYAYDALHRAGFGFTGESTGLAELVLDFPAPVDGEERYLDGLTHFDERELTDEERAFLANCRERGRPDPEEYIYR